MSAKIRTLAHILPMKARDVNEHHRAATSLELLFDLVSVIAIAAAAAGLHHSIAEAHFGEGIAKYLAIFFAIWWAWMNYTWFSSAYDNDDTVFRLLTMVIMSGSLTLAAGVSPFFESSNLFLVVAGFVIMRLALVVLWLRAARHDLPRRQTALWYAGGIFVAQIYWVALLLVQPLPPAVFYVAFAVGAILELSVPLLAERKASTPWHRHHMIERYGLLNIIVLGEILLSGSIAINKAFSGHFEIALVHTVLVAMVTVFSLWWLYFSREEHLKGQDLSSAFSWGYGHLLIYLSGAAVGAGFAVLVDIITDHAKVPLIVGDYAVAVPVALYLAGLWLVRDRVVLQGAGRFVLPAFAVVVLLVPLVLALEGIALAMVLCVIVRSHLACRE